MLLYSTDHVRVDVCQGPLRIDAIHPRHQQVVSAAAPFASSIEASKTRLHSVLFSTFLDISAAYALLPIRGASVEPKKFPPEFRAALPQHLHYLLDWEHPEDQGENPSGSWGMAENKAKRVEVVAEAKL